ncbi:hypothetical protein CYPRO_3257 [Cyclonatronum proteinivorum]|uniref:Uncharacterized protein n=1 Tax=Cyclonatronum proteinivorum TaxID=1457365 RepID=A0A345UPT8_9BACT|nr:hypothetical protein CYPRO_3257 [Cyclonatronum proteinivorum]
MALRILAADQVQKRAHILFMDEAAALIYPKELPEIEGKLLIRVVRDQLAEVEGEDVPTR